jgi:hypothetical protein
METYVHRTQMPQLPATGTRGQDSPPFIQNYEKIVLYPSATSDIYHHKIILSIPNSHFKKTSSIYISIRISKSKMDSFKKGRVALKSWPQDISDGTGFTV